MSNDKVRGYGATAIQYAEYSVEQAEKAKEALAAHKEAARALLHLEEIESAESIVQAYVEHLRERARKAVEGKALPLPKKGAADEPVRS